GAGAGAASIADIAHRRVVARFARSPCAPRNALVGAGGDPLGACTRRSRTRGRGAGRARSGTRRRAARRQLEQDSPAVSAVINGPAFDSWLAILARLTYTRAAAGVAQR